MRSILVAVFLFSVSSASDCPSGAIYNANFNKCYLVMATKDAYQLAEQYCNNIGGHLASIQNAFENSYVAQLAQTNCGFCFRNYWIGATDQGSSNYTFVWTDGTPFVYSNWLPGKKGLQIEQFVGMPDHDSYNNCVYMTPGAGDWVTDVCHSKNSFVCEFIPKNSTSL